MKRTMIVLAVFLLMMAMTGASANWYFAQDDFWVYMPDGEGSAGQEVYADGRILEWDANKIVGWFELTGANSAGATAVGNQYQTIYDTATLKIWGGYNPITKTFSDLLWEGTGYWNTLVNMDESVFDASLFDRPDYEDEPTTFTSVGDGWFDYTAGSWAEWNAMDVEWLGTYNWSYLGDDYLVGNAQAKINPIPEPGSLLVLGTGAVGLMGVIRRRKK